MSVVAWLRARARWLRYGALVFPVGAGGWQLWLLLQLWLGRVRYAWDAEWLEGAALYQAYRVMHGLPTFGSPRDGYLPQNHPPLFPVVLAGLGKVFGLNYPVARTFSLLCFVGAAGLGAAALLRRFGKGPRGWALAALSIGCVAAGTSMVMGVVDMVRDDSFCAFLCAVGATLVPRRARLRTGRIVLLALTVAAIIYARLPAVFIASWIVLFVLLRDRTSGVRLAILAAACCGVILVGLLFMSHGWYWLLTIGMVQDQHVRWERVNWATSMILGFAPFLPALVPLAIGLAVVRRLSWASTLWFGMLVAAIPASLLPWSKVGGFENDFVPLYVFLGPATAFLMGDLAIALGRWPWVSRGVEGALVLAGSAFLVARTWSPEHWTPTEAMRSGARDLNAQIAALDGGVVAPRHPFLPIQNGHSTLGWDEMPYLDMLWSNYSDLSLGKYVEQAGARYALITGTELPLTAKELSTRYQLDRVVNGSPGMIVGDASSIRFILRANDDEKNGHVVFDFESLDGWTATAGTGATFRLAEPHPSWQQTIDGALGRHVADSFGSPGWDRATGTIVSPQFPIDRPRMSVRVGGGTRPATRVELRVDGRVERRATSIWHDQETLTRVVWDVTPFVGKRAQIALVDEDSGSWGHLTCDHIVLY
jgi:hypothetical protein